MGCLAGSPRATRNGGFACSGNALAGAARAAAAAAAAAPPRPRGDCAFHRAAKRRAAKFHSADAGVAT